MDLECCWSDETDVVAEAIRGDGHREAPCFVLRGGPGQGVSDAVHALSRQAGARTTIWVDAVSDEAHGTHARVSRQESLDGPPTPALTRPVGEVEPQPAAGLQSVSDALHLLGDDQTGHGRLVLVDGFHLLPPSDATMLVEWLQQQRFTDAVIVVGVHPIECAPDLGGLLTVLGPATGIDLPRLATEQLTTVLSRRHPTCLPQSLARIAQFARGIPALALKAADHHCIQARTDGHGDSLERSLELAVLRVSVPILARHGADDFHLGLAAALAPREPLPSPNMQSSGSVELVSDSTRGECVGSEFSCAGPAGIPAR